MFFDTNGFQHLDFSNFVRSELSESNTSITMCGLPITPFECIHIRVRRVDTRDILIEELFEALSENHTIVLFVASLSVLHTCLHRLQFLRKTSSANANFLVGTSCDRIAKFTPLCKAAKVPVRSTSRIMPFKLPMKRPTLLCMGSLIKQYYFCGLMAQMGFEMEHFLRQLAKRDDTKGADFYNVDVPDVGLFLLLVFTHPDLAWNAYACKESWWPLDVELISAPRLQAAEFTIVHVTRLNTCSNVVEKDVDVNLIEILN